MGRAPCCEKIGLNRGPWTTEEDRILIDYINQNGHGNWRKLPKKAGLLRCGKSCRLRWINYLRPDVKRGEFTQEEEDTIIKLHQELGNKWSAIAKMMPGRTDNEIKNVWNIHLKKKVDNIVPLVSKKRSRRSKITEVVAQNNEKPQVQNAQDSTIDEKSPKHSVEATLLELIKSGDQNSANITSSDENSSPSVAVATNYNGGTSSCSSTSAISDGLSEFLEIEDDFSWSDAISADLAHNIIPSFDESLHDDNMKFWYNIYTRDGSIEDFLHDYP